MTTAVRVYIPWNKGRAQPLADRFWPRVDKSGECWRWTGGLYGATRYGCVYAGAKRGNVSAHRISWELHFGAIPDGLYVCHRCDNRQCVTPAHLFIGTPSDNLTDCHNKGRSVHRTNPHLLARGERVATAKLTAEYVREIRALHADGHTMRALASEYGVTKDAIRSVVKGRTWRHVV